jgi:formate dehydrogenase subunit delta
MHIDNLVHMANRIGEFFQAMPDPEEARREIAQHLRKFWEPRMRRALLEHLDDAGGDGLLEIVRDAVREHRDALMPTTTA